MEATLLATNRRDLPAQAAHLPAERSELPCGVEHREHTVSPLPRRGVERALDGADLPHNPLAAGLFSDFETLHRAAPARLHDHVACAAHPLARAIRVVAVARVLSQHAQLKVAEGSLDHTVGSARTNLLANHRAAADVARRRAASEGGLVGVPPAGGVARKVRLSGWRRSG